MEQTPKIEKCVPQWKLATLTHLRITDNAGSITVTKFIISLPKRRSALLCYGINSCKNANEMKHFAINHKSQTNDFQRMI